MPRALHEITPIKHILTIITDLSLPDEDQEKFSTSTFAEI